MLVSKNRLKVAMATQVESVRGEKIENGPPSSGGLSGMHKSETTVYPNYTDLGGSELHVIRSTCELRAPLSAAPNEEPPCIMKPNQFCVNRRNQW